MISSVMSRRSGKQYHLIKSLPDNPDKIIIWVVYNKDMVKATESMIASIRGEDYVSKHVKVVTRKYASKYNGSIYFDPTLYDLLGNGRV